MPQIHHIHAGLELLLSTIANIRSNVEVEFTPEDLREICKRINETLYEEVGDAIPPLEDEFTKGRLEQLKVQYPDLYTIRYHLGEKTTIVVGDPKRPGIPRQQYFERNLTTTQRIMYKAVIGNVIECWWGFKRRDTDGTIHLANLRTIAALLRIDKNKPVGEEIYMGPGA